MRFSICFFVFSLLLFTLPSCGMPGGTEWIWIFVVILLLFGGKKIPELMRGIGRGIRELNDAKDGLKKEFEEGKNEKPSYDDTNQRWEYSNPAPQEFTAPSPQKKTSAKKKSATKKIITKKAVSAKPKPATSAQPTTQKTPMPAKKKSATSSSTKKSATKKK